MTAVESVMRSQASAAAKDAVLAACDARVGCAAVDSLADRMANRLYASLPRTEAYVAVLAGVLTAGLAPHLPVRPS